MASCYTTSGDCFSGANYRIRTGTIISCDGSTCTLILDMGDGKHYNVLKEYFMSNAMNYCDKYLVAGRRVRLVISAQGGELNWVELEGIEIILGTVALIQEEKVYIDYVYQNQRGHIVATSNFMSIPMQIGDKFKLYHTNDVISDAEFIPRPPSTTSSPSHQPHSTVSTPSPPSMPPIPSIPSPSSIHLLPFNPLTSSQLSSRNSSISLENSAPRDKVINYELQNIIETVGERRLPLSSLKTLFSANSKILDNINNLEKSYESWRRVNKNDNNSFYRAVGISYLEHLSRVTTIPQEFERFIFKLKYDPLYSTPSMPAEAKQKFVDFLQNLVTEKKTGKPIIEDLYHTFKYSNFNEDLIRLMKSLASNIFSFSSKSFESWTEDQKQGYLASFNTEPGDLAPVKALAQVLGVTLKINSHLDGEDITIEADDVNNQPILYLLRYNKGYDILYTKEQNLADRYDVNTLKFTKMKFNKAKLAECRKSFYSRPAVHKETTEEILANYAIDLQNLVYQQIEIMKNVAKDSKDAKVRAVLLKSFPENIVPLSLRTDSSSNKALNDVKDNEMKLVRQDKNKTIIRLGCMHEFSLESLKKHLSKERLESNFRQTLIRCPLCMYCMSEREIMSIEEALDD